MKRFTNLTLIMLLMLSTMLVISCEKTTDPDPETITYIGHTATRQFDLVITELIEESRAYTPKVGDSYSLTSGNLTKTGTITEVGTDGGFTVLRLVPTSDTNNLRANVAANGLHGIYGNNIVWNNNTSESVPMALMPGVLVPSTADFTVQIQVTDDNAQLAACEFLVDIQHIGAATDPASRIEFTAISNVSINPETITVDLQSSLGNFIFATTTQNQEDGKYHRLWRFSSVNGFPQASTIEVTVNGIGTIASDIIEMVYIPTNLTPATFSHATATTFGWTLTASSDKQYAIFEWDSAMLYDNIFNITLQPNDRTWVRPTTAPYVVPADWAHVYFDLYEINSKLVGTNLTLTSSRQETKTYTAGGAAPASRNVDETEHSIRIYNLTRNSK